MFGMHDDMDEDVVDEVLFKKLGIESQKNFPFAFAGVPEHFFCRKVEFLVEYFITAYSAFSGRLFLFMILTSPEKVFIVLITFTKSPSGRFNKSSLVISISSNKYPKVYLVNNNR